MGKIVVFLLALVVFALPGHTEAQTWLVCHFPSGGPNGEPETDCWAEANQCGGARVTVTDAEYPNRRAACRAMSNGIDEDIKNICTGERHGCAR